jgi:hypothetical protein
LALFLHHKRVLLIVEEKLIFFNAEFEVAVGGFLEHERGVDVLHVVFIEVEFGSLMIIF